ncbi:ATP-binding protein [Streptomyces sp. 4N509B]|uniref:ATP-binding protein n=1 Tax=Streptomyces sp. 4N509B TaxID=3457413 RepID=UPI003FD50D6F
MSMWWSLQLRREAASVPLARRLLLGAMEAAGVDADISHDLSVALSEACSNAVRHGGAPPSDAAGEVYRVTAFIDDELCRIEVADDGPGFAGGAPAPVRESEPRELAQCGRGLHLIEALSDRVCYGNGSGSGGAVVRFDRALKRREAAADAALLRAG